MSCIVVCTICECMEAYSQDYSDFGQFSTHADIPRWYVISQIWPGYVWSRTGEWVAAFTDYRRCFDCGNLINSMYYKEYLQSDQDSTSVLEQISKIVSSSTDFRQLAGCAQFSAKWAFVVTWVEAGDGFASRVHSMVSMFMRMCTPTHMHTHFLHYIHYIHGCWAETSRDDATAGSGVYTLEVGSSELSTPVCPSQLQPT